MGTGLNAELLKTKMLVDLTSAGFDLNNAPATKQFVDIIAKAIVEHIQTQAMVMPTALVAPPSGGPVTGTGTIM